MYHIPTMHGAEALKKWMSAHGHRSSDMARLVEVDDSTVRHWCNGTAMPSGEKIARIEYITGGEITSRHWYPEQFRGDSRSVAA